MDVTKELLQRLEKVQEKFDAESERKNLVENRNFNRASSLGWTQDCLRYLINKRIYPEQEIITPEQKKRMREGHIQERMMREEVQAAGIEVIKTDPLLWTAYNIKGEVDDQIKLDGDILPLDYKSCSSAVFKEVSRCPDSEGLLKSRFPWIRHYPAQLETYNHLYDHKAGLLLFKNKESGEKHSILVPKNDAFMSLILDGVVIVNEAVKKREIPPPIWIDSCKRCGYNEACWKPEERGEKEVRRIADEDLEVLLARREILSPLIKEYENIDEQVKENLKLIGGDFLVGDFKVNNTIYRKKSFEIPEAVKKEYEKIIEITRTSIKFLGGAL